MIPEDGTGLINSDTYVDPTSGRTTGYLAGHLYIEAWTAADAARKEAAVIMATRTLDSLYRWYGKRGSLEQALGWPRTGLRIDGVTQTGVPTAIHNATLELAMALLERNRLSDTSSGSQSIEKISLGSGALSLDFGADPLTAATEASEMIPAYLRMNLWFYGRLTRPTQGMTPVERR